MAFREAIFPKALQLIKDLHRKIFVIAVLSHAFEKPLSKTIHAATSSPCGHGTTQLIGVIRGERGSHHGDLLSLFLKDGNAQRTCQHLLELGRRGGYRLAAV